MKIGINATYAATASPTGVGQYIRYLIQYLLKNDQQNEYTLFYRYKKVKKQEFPGLGPVEKHFEPRLSWLFGEKLDLFHDPSFKYINYKNSKIITTVHDCICAVREEFGEYKYIHSAHLRVRDTGKLFNSVKKTDAIITVSEFSKNEIMKYFRVKEEKIYVVHSGVDRNIFNIKNANSKNRELLKYGRYLLFIGSIEFRKNIINIIKALNEINKRYDDIKLLIIGKPGYGYETIMQYIKDNKNVILLKYIPTETLSQYYNSSLAFMFPSFYEGFGLPVLEAFACGTPVVTSRNSSIPEVAGNAALYVDPENYGDIAEKVLYLMNDQNERERLIEKGLQRVELFSWNETAKKTIAVYNKVMEL